MEAGKGEWAHQRSAAGAISVPSMVALEVGTLCGRAELGMPWPAPMLPWVFGGCCMHGGRKLAVVLYCWDGLDGDVHRCRPCGRWRR